MPKLDSNVSLSGRQGIKTAWWGRGGLGCAAFEAQVEQALYGITSTKFEGHGPPGLVRHGHAPDRPPRVRQAALGLMLIDVWMIAHHPFAVNCKDATTVTELMHDLWRGFGLQRIVLVGDRALIDSTGRAVPPEEAGCAYLVGLSRRQGRVVEKMLAEARRTPLEDSAVVLGPA